jgi:hypothetical protein
MKSDRDPSDSNVLDEDPNAIEGHNPFDRLRDDTGGKALQGLIFNL